MGGLNTAIDYCIQLGRTSSNYLKTEWSTEYLVDPVFCSTMICVRLPDKFLENILGKNILLNPLSYDHAEIVQNYLYFDSNTEVPVKCIQNMLYVRLSFHIYNNIDDYKKLAKIVLDKC